MSTKDSSGNGSNKVGTPPPSGSSAVSRDNPAGLSSFKLVLLAMMVLQNSSNVLVGRYTRSGPPDELYEVNHALLMVEFSKLVLSCGLEFHTTQGKLVKSIRTHILDRPMDALKILIPAMLYLLQNTLLYVALTNLTAPIFQVTYQGKLVTTALVSVLMLQRSYSPQQWICLVGISFGVAVVVLGEKGGDDEEKKKENTNLFLGLVAVSISCMSSALAGVYFEKVLKKTQTDATQVPNASLWMRNIQLAFFSVLIAAVQGSMKDTGKPYFYGFNTWTWVLIALQAGGGLLVAAVIKYADNVLKGLATGVSVVLSSALSMMLFSTPLGAKFFAGGILILVSVWFFSNPLPAACLPKEKKEDDDGGDHGNDHVDLEDNGSGSELKAMLPNK